MHRIVYGAISLVAISIYILQQVHFPLPPLINNYANDLLCMPLVLGGISYVIRKIKDNKSFRLSLVFVICMAAYYSFYFEYYLPQHAERYTSDWIDVCLYFAGSLAFYCYEEKILYASKKE